MYLARFSFRVGMCLMFAHPLALNSGADAIQRDQAEAQARAFLESFERGDYRELYRNSIGRRFKDAVTEEAFVANLSITRRRLGGAGSGRRLIDERPVTELPTPQGPVVGTFYWFRYRTSYPAGNAYEDVYVELEGSDWLVVGVWVNPAPDQAIGGSATH